ncbi:1,2-phenylacetyl-CoA epoxidase subunit PaaC [Hoeflea poritis]|uniref:Phenylacetate-CoA oxygenase subunit PaaC n=1 Tax=Hoeflea poritis TaxID=2993659 RepID=A0ABT4VU38_9HYPH|nr:1,2-phenylacetyl-CoA epoxidase subunit PaaC [Hoeflea poritis]MDA4847710.1 phenylacetate-CoA oxygenase subunit PaaC [Hoeflea poritis]
MAKDNTLFTYLLRLADDHLILSQRLGEWTGRAPTLEEDLALTNIALDLIGQARSLYSYAGAVEGQGRDEDQLAFTRPERDYLNALIVEQPNGDFAHTIVRQFFIAAFMVPFWREMEKSDDEQLAAIAAKASKEVAYHLRHTAEWVVRLGDGTEESHQRMVEALEGLIIYTGELFENDAIAKAAIAGGYGVDTEALRDEWRQTVVQVLGEATLELPNAGYMQKGGRDGVHTEHLGHILSELQYMQRAYPGLTW